MKIKEVEELTGMTQKAIRFYEEHELVHPERSENGYRYYTEEDVRTLKEVAFLRRLQIPIASIRKLKNGDTSLEECMIEHAGKLEKNRLAIDTASELCKEIAHSGKTISQLDFDEYEENFHVIEDGGRIMNSMEEFNHKKMRSTNIGVLVFIALMLMLEGIIIFAQKMDPMPVGLFVVISAVILSPIIGVLWAVNERRKELMKGEEYEAFKY